MLEELDDMKKKINSLIISSLVCSTHGNLGVRIAELDKNVSYARFYESK